MARKEKATRRLARLAIVGIALAVLPAAGHAAPEGTVSIELNKLEPNGAACRAYVVLNNATEAVFKTLKLDLVMFDTDGIVAKRLAVETAPLAAGKTSLKVFDIDGLGCPQIGRMLLNDVISCDASGDSSGDCLAAMAPKTRGDVPFIK